MEIADTRLTPRQREWLEHLRACKSENATIRGYARRRGLAEQSMYQAASALRKRGLLTAAPAATKGPVGRRRSAKFVEVGAARAEIPLASWRARLPNGVVVEGSGAIDGELLSQLAAL